MADPADTFVQFVRSHWRRLHLVARRYAASEHDAQDLLQETFLRAWRNFSPTEERAYRGAWLFVILRNVAAEWARASGRRIKLVPMSDAALTEILPPDLTEPLAPFPSFDDRAFRDFLRDRIATAIEGLADPFREVLVLSVAGDLTYREVAEVLGCPVGTVMSRMARARRALREQLAEFAHVRTPTKEERT